MIPNDPLGLPGGERSERPQFGDDGLVRHRCGSASRFAVLPSRDGEMIFAHIEREPLPSAASTIRIGWPARTFSPTSAAMTVTTRQPQHEDHLVKPALDTVTGRPRPAPAASAIARSSR